MNAPIPRASADVSHPDALAGETRAADRAATARTHIRPRRGWQAVNLAELWRARDLLWIFALRDIKVRYKQTFFGYAWALLVPVTQVLVFTVFFGQVLGVSERVNRAAGRALPYPLFALAGQIVWNLFRMTVEGASSSLLTNAAIIRKIYLPRLVLPLAAAGKPLVDTLVVFGLLIALTLWYAVSPDSDIQITPRLLLSPLFLAAALLPALGIGLLMAAVTVNYRDLHHVLPFFTSILFFMTPVIYSVEVLPERLAWLMHLNPVAALVEAHRAAVLNLPIDWTSLAIGISLALVLVVAGLFAFARAERSFADVA